VERIKEFRRDILKCLKENSVEEEVLAYTQTDMTLTGEIAGGFVILTKSELVCVLTERTEKEIFHFKGSGLKSERFFRSEDKYTLEKLPLKDIESLQVLRNVSGGILCTGNQKEQNTEALRGDSSKASKITEISTEKNTEISEEKKPEKNTEIETEQNKTEMSRELKIAAFTNLRMAEVMHFVKLFSVFNNITNWTI